MRLNKFLAQAGVASRRAADKLIAAGRVKVNGRVVREMGLQIDPDQDKVTVDGKPVSAHRKTFTYLLLNKPPGYITSRKDLKAVAPSTNSSRPVTTASIPWAGSISRARALCSSRTTAISPSA